MKTHRNQVVAKVYSHQEGYRGMLISNPEEDNEWVHFAIFNLNREELREKLKHKAFCSSFSIIAFWDSSAK